MQLHVIFVNVLDAFAKPSAGNWAAQDIKYYRLLGLPSPFVADGSVVIDMSSSSKLIGKQHEVWHELHASRRSAPSKRAKLCTDPSGLHASGLVQSAVLTCPRGGRDCAACYAPGLVPTTYQLAWADDCI